MDNIEELLKQLVEASGIPGHEKEVHDIMRSHLQQFGEIGHDKLGSLICEKQGKAKEPRVMLVGFDVLRPGISEFSLDGVVEHAMRDAGDMFTWSVTGNEIASGYRQCYTKCGTVIPSNKIIQYGDVVTIDIHPTTFSGYRSDLGLNAVVGLPSDSIRRLGDKWGEIVWAEIDALKPGRTVHEIACDVENAVTKLKLDPHYKSSVGGHGLGTEARMPPTIRKGDE